MKNAEEIQISKEVAISNIKNKIKYTYIRMHRKSLITNNIEYCVF